MEQNIPFRTYVEHLSDQVITTYDADNPVIRNASTDSRQTGSGDLFIAVKGTQVDGTDFIPDAVAAGAKAIVAETKPEVPSDVAFVQVHDAYIAAGRIAEVHAGFPAHRMRMIGITGTNGKTTTTLLLHHILEWAERKVGCMSTLYHWVGSGQFTEAERTTPMPFDFQSLLNRMLANGVQDVVLEISSHALQQERCGTTPFAAAAFTNLAPEHLDFHGTMEAYYQAKKKLFTQGLQENGTAVINTDDSYGERMVEEMQTERSDVAIVTVSVHEHSDVVISDIQTDQKGSDCTLQKHTGKAHSLKLSTPMPGRYNLYNASMAAVMACELGIDQRLAADAVVTYSATPGRLERIEVSDTITAFVDYAHTEDALKNVLQTLSELQPKTLIVVCGCGGDRDKEKRPRMARVAQEFADRVYLTSDNPRHEDPAAILQDMQEGLLQPAGNVHTMLDRRQAIRTAITVAEAGDVILVAGKGHETFQQFGDEKYPFDDREEVKKAIAERT